MKTSVSCALAIAFGSVALGGCAHDYEPPPSRPIAPLRGPHPGEGDQTRQANVDALLLFSVDGVDLSQEQKNEVARIQADLHARTDAARAVEKSMLLAIADGVAGGAVDEQKLVDGGEKLGTAAGAARDLAAAAINKLHAMLRPEQRFALVATVVGRWSTGTEVPGTAPRIGPPDQMILLIRDFAMTQEQVDRTLKGGEVTMRGPSADPWRVDAHLHRLEAFKADAFDATAFVGDKAAHARNITADAKRVAHLYTILTPILQPDQRAKLAQRLRDRANRIQ